MIDLKLTCLCNEKENFLEHVRGKIEKKFYVLKDHKCDPVISC